MATTISTPAPATHDHETYPIAELFYSFQGEGVNLGRRALFVRFMRCNLTCGYRQVPRHLDTPVDGAMRCDTEYTWNGARHSMSDGVRRLTPPRIWDELTALDPSSADPTVAPVDLLVVSGGEPLLHQAAVLYLAQQAAHSGRDLEVETNATISPGEALIAANVAFNASIKLASSAVPHAKRIKPAVIWELCATGRTRWKFVITGPDDLGEIAKLQTEFGLTNVWLSPEGCTATAVIDHMRMVADAALARGWNLTTRQHVLIWDGDRGR